MQLTRWVLKRGGFKQAEEGRGNIPDGENYRKPRHPELTL